MSDQKNDAKEKNQESSNIITQDHIVETKNTITISGKKISYTIRTGTIVLKEECEKNGEKAGESEGEKPKASIFFTAYMRDDIDDEIHRPIAFAFNGGPGSSSAWLHLGTLGPRRVVMNDVGNLLPPPYGIADNPESLLDVTDLVFIDPMSTGYSRVLAGEKVKEYLNFKKDIESVGDFIRLFTTRYQRWLSPKFLIGESYGTTRSAGLSGYLQERHGLYLNGIMLISSILDFGTVDANPGNDLPYILYLPVYAATAWYHNAVNKAEYKDFFAFLKEAEKFAMNDYTVALMKGSSISADERVSITEKLSLFTGLSRDYIDRVNLRPEIMRFTKELLRQQHKTVGRLDSRFTGYDRDSGGEEFEHDPSYSAILGPYTAAFCDYVRRELRYESDLPYEILSIKANENWSYSQHENKYVEVTETLRKAISTNPHLKIFVANGYFDLATPYFATEYTFNHLNLNPELESNISMEYYEAGHMMYVHEDSRKKLKKDLADFILKTAGNS